MADQLIISVSGMRGTIGESLTASAALDYGCAFGTYLKESNPKSRLVVCVGMDSRPSGQMIKSAVTAGLTGVGINVVDLGLVTTPCVGISVKELGCAGGVVITASHNPIQYNGIKLLLGSGIAPPLKTAAKIKQCFLDKNFINADSTGCGKVTFDNHADSRHIAKVLTIIDKELIAAKKFKVALDSVNGSGGQVTKKLLTELGCEISAINDEPTGMFSHGPEPIADNLMDFCKFLRTKGVDVGFAQDPDADRLAIVDEKGTYIGEEYSLAMAAQYIFSKKAGRAATNLSTSRMIDDIAGRANGQVIRTPVGEANVASAMLQHDCIIGGEGNGGVIDLRVGPIRDSLVGIALVLQLMAETGKTISRLASEIGGYYMSKDKFIADHNQAQQIFTSAKKAFGGAKIDSTDGCRFDFDDGWLHIRASNTEPVIRVIVEAKNQVTAQKYIDVVSKIREEVLG